MLNRSSKKQKEKKDPQRGLGVAELERIRLEEQQKTDASANPLPPNFHPPSPTIDLRPMNSSTVSLPKPYSWFNVTVPGRGNVGKLRNCFDYSIGNENSVVNSELGFRGNLNLAYESNPNWPPLQGFMQRTPPYQQPCSSMVKVPSATSSSVLNSPMEPPSNQSYYGNNVPVWPEEEKNVGMKRPYPFSLDNPPGHHDYQKRPSNVHPNSRSYGSSLFSNGCTFDVEQGNYIPGEGPSGSSSIEPNSKESIKENEVICGDFLTLAPPGITPMCPSPNFKPFHTCNKPDLSSHPFQESAEEPAFPARPIIRNQQQQPFYSFIPPSQTNIGQATSTSHDCNGEVGENVDLDLKL